jgi:NADH-quinone oxidoreductase subunit N
VFGALYAQWLSVVLVLAVLTMTVGNIIAISQSSLKRMLAYSSIAHAGYLLVGVLAASAARHGATPNLDAARDAIGGVLFYLVAYALMNMGAFAVLVYLENARDVLGPISRAMMPISPSMTCQAWHGVNHSSPVR